MKSKFLTELDCREMKVGTWKLLSDLMYTSALLNRTVCVPKGFETDFASVPRIPIIYMFFGNREHRESVIHDYLYRTVPHICTRKQADEVFLEAMKVREKNVFVRKFMYWGVRLGGSSSWK